MSEQIKRSMEARAYNLFLQKYKGNHFKEQRLGQAFYNEFSLHKLTDQVSLRRLYIADDAEATKIIHTLFEFH